MIPRRIALGLLLLVVLAPAYAQSPGASAQKPTLSRDDYSKFETVGGATLSPDGKWIAYTVGRGGRGGGRGGGGGGAGGELHYRAVGTDADKVIAGGSAPTFTANNRWMLYTLAPAGGGGGGAGAGGRAGRGGAGGGRGAAPASGAGGGSNRASVGVLDLSTGATSTIYDVQSYVLSSDGHHVALRRYPPQGAQGRGADIVIRDLATNTDVSLGNVAEFAWNDAGSLLAMTVDVAGRTGNGVQLFATSTSTLRALDAGDMLYSNLRWRRKSDDLVVFRSRPDSAYIDTSYAVIAWRGVTAAGATPVVYDFAADASFPKEMRVAAYRAPQWSDDGSTVFFGIASREPKPETPGGRGNGPSAVRVQVWHWKDLREWPQQRQSANQDLTRTHLVGWRVGEHRIVRLGDEKMPNVQLSQNQKVALGSDESPYFMEAISGRAVRDVYTIDVASGKRTKVLTRAQGNPALSPSGRYLLYSQGDEKSGNWFVMDLTTGAKTNLTGSIRSVFVNMEDDHPTPFRRPYGNAGWLADEKSLIVYDRFDLWQINVDGTNPMRLTRGREDSTVYRADWTGYEDPTIDPARPILLTATGEFNKKEGFARLTLGKPAQRLFWVDRNVGTLTKAADAEVYAFTMQTASEAPQLYVSTAAFSDAKQVSNTNQFLKDFAWGRQVLMDYRNKRGDKLQMMLTYPADYQPGKKYPMVVYYYEKLSQGFHSFIVPSASAMYNVTVFSQAGYFVLRPDILFQPRNAGPSGLDCVTSAVRAAEAAVADIDPKRVGAMGHSWGGYQSAYYAVHGSDVFAAAIAGAPLTNFISMYGYSSGNTGSPETGHFETGQERMQVSLWEDPAAYIRNSTVFQTDQLKIPLLLEEGEADGNVNYYQSMELYNFGRRLGKNVVFLVYEGENHGLTGDAATDYAQRQLEWFGHWLKGEPAADWIVNGETYLARKKILDAANPPQETEAAGRGAPPAGGRGGGRGGRGGGRGG
jgi:dipeptidyl aminopeptidase/acylaminoacyl peptidase